MAIKDNLQAYWDLSEASGNRADSHTNGLTLTDTNTVTGTTGPGSHNASFFTRANSELLTRANNSLLNVGDIDFTVALWAKLTAENNAMALASQTSNSGTQRAWKIYADLSSHAFVIWVSNTGANQVFAGNADTMTGTGVWHYVVFWHDSAANTINLQTNNGTAASASHWAGVWTSTGPFELGAEDANPNYFDGALAMCGFWKRVLTTDEKTFLYNSGNGRNYAELDPALAITPTVATASISGIASRNNYGLITPTMTKI